MIRAFITHVLIVVFIQCASYGLVSAVWSAIDYFEIGVKKRPMPAQVSTDWQEKFPILSSNGK